MTIYDGKLSLRKETAAMLVFGNELMRAQYFPKTLFKKKGKKYPAHVRVTITLEPQQKSGSSRKQ